MVDHGLYGCGHDFVGILAITSPASAQTRRKIRGMGSFAAALFLVSALKQNGIAVILSAAKDLQLGSSRSRAVSPAQDDQRCKSPRSDLTQAEMNVCAEEDFRRVDARLNVAYDRLLKGLDPDRRLKLQRAERAWLAFRDAHCIYEASDSEGGTIHRLEVATCKTELTNARIAQLRE